MSLYKGEAGKMRYTKAATVRSQSYIFSEAHPAHPQVPEPPEPVPESGCLVKENTASPGPSDTSVSKLETQMSEEYGGQSDAQKKRWPKTTPISS